MDVNNLQQLHILHRQYAEKATQYQVTWDETYDDERPKPTLYDMSTMKDLLPKISEVSSFISQLADAEKLTQEELYVALENSQMALKAAQDEYLAIEMLLRHMQGSNTDEVGNPQALEDFDVYDEKKTAMLYGYKYDPKVTLTSLKVQDPFAQGGFVPTESHMNRMRVQAVAAGSDLKNVDGWEAIEKDGRKMIPRVYWQPKKPKPKAVQTPPRQTRKRSHEAMEASEQSRPTSSEGSTKQLDGHLLDKRLTRFNGGKVPQTREATPAESGTPSKRRRQQSLHPPTILSAAASPAPEDSPTPSRGGTPARVTPTPRKQKSKPVSEKEKPKWTNESLLEAIRLDPTFLHPTDPVKREQRRLKLLEAPNPVRSFSMFSKWGDWRAKGEDKRPRKKSPKE